MKTYLKIMIISMMLVMLAACVQETSQIRTVNTSNEITGDVIEEISETKEKTNEETSQESVKESAQTDSVQTETNQKEPTKTETTKTETTKTESIQTNKNTVPEKINYAEVMEEITTPAQNRTKMYKFLELYLEKVNSYEFNYKGNKYYIKGQKIKIELENAKTAKDVTFGDVKRNLFYYDTVYLDRTAKTAEAYCEGHKSQINKQCAQLDLYDLRYPVNFIDYNVVLPEDWLLTYLDTEPDYVDENKYYIEGRKTTTAIFFQTPELELSFDAITGLLLRADTKSKDRLITRQDYEKIAHNLVKDVDVIHRSKSEIPSSEVFMR